MAEPRRLVVLGNCQATIVAAHLRRITRDWEVIGFQLRPSGDGAEDLMAAARSADRVIAQTNPQPALAALSPKGLAEAGCRVSPLPNITFGGYHPDSVYIGGDSPIRSPTGDYHSSLIVAAFLAGLPHHRVPALFNAYIFARAGFFDRYGQARALLIRHGDAIGFDMRDLVARWEQEAPFMHSVNHPKPHVLADVACRAAELAGIETCSAEGPEEPDSLGRSAWPVHAEIGRRQGFEPAPLMFRSRAGDAYTLAEYVQRAYAVYAAAPQVALTGNRQVSVLAVMLAAEVR